MNTQDLRNTFRGPVHRPGDEQYDAQRAAFNPNLDARPLLVAEATGAADVRTAVTWARDHNLPLAVQATGHGTKVPSNGGLLIKTQRMATVLVDPDRRIAKVGPDARWGDVVAAAAPFGLAPLSGTNATVGVAGYTFGGGFSMLSRKYGFAADSLVRADIVTADGALVTASPERDAELFWAVRGGGGNFGIATSLEVRLHPVVEVFAGVVRFPAERAAETLAYFGEWAATEPDELSTAIILDQSPTFTIKTLYTGAPSDARRLLRPLWTVAGQPVEEDLRTVRYADVKTPSVPPRTFDMYASLPDGIADLVRPGSPVAAVEVKHWGGAMARPSSDAGPAGHRDLPFSIGFNGPADAAPAVRRHARGSFLNFLHDPGAVETAFTPENLRKLGELKRAYDPENVFRFNANITPATRDAELVAAR
jgi:FAD/FMN-containing dehydrogenase